MSFLGQHRSHVPVFSGMVHWHFPQQHRQCWCFRYTAKIIVCRYWFICPVQPVIMDRNCLPTFFWCVTYNLVLLLVEPLSLYNVVWRGYFTSPERLFILGWGLGRTVGQGWRSGESTDLLSLWPGSNMWVEFVVRFSPLLREFFSPVFPSTEKPTFPNFNSTRNGRRRTTMWMSYL